MATVQSGEIGAVFGDTFVGQLSLAGCVGLLHSVVSFPKTMLVNKGTLMPP